jgi:hypothetical protein
MRAERLAAKPIWRLTRLTEWGEFLARASVGTRLALILLA